MPDANSGSDSPAYQARHTSPRLEAAIRVLVDITAAFAAATEEADRMDAEKAQVKEAAILRLMEATNPLSRNAERHSASSAEKVVEEDQQYATWLAKRRRATVSRIVAEGQFFVAQARVLYWAHRGSDPQVLERATDRDTIERSLASMRSEIPITPSAT